MNSQDYWRKREEDWIKQQIKDDAKQSKVIAEKYQRSLDQIQKEIDANWERFAGKEGVSLTEAKKKALEMDVESFARKARQYVKEKNFSKTANDELRLYNVTMRTSRLELLKSQIGLELVALSDDVDKYTAQTLTKAGAAEAKRQAGILGETVFKDYRSFVDSVANGSFQGATFSERIWGNTSALKANLDKLLIRSITQGRNPREMARELRNIFGSSKYEAERLMRTETARVQTAVQKESYRQYDVEEYEFIAEPTACPICKTIDGKVFQSKKMSIGLNVPPMHPNCRCSTAPYVDRAALDRRLEEIEAFDKMSPAEKMAYLTDQMEKLEDGKWGKMTESQAEDLYDKYDAQFQGIRANMEYNKGELGSEFKVVDAELETTLQEQSDEWFAQLSKRQRLAINNFTGTWYDDMNGMLRVGGYDSSDNDFVYFNIDNLGKAIDQFKLQDSIRVYRGISKDEYEAIKSGKVFNEFKSCSIDEEVATSFASTQGANGKVVTFLVPKNANSAYVGKNSASTGEKELILNRGSTYTVKETDKGLEVTIDGENKKELPAFSFDDDGY